MNVFDKTCKDVKDLLELSLKLLDGVLKTNDEEATFWFLNDLSNNMAMDIEMIVRDKLNKEMNGELNDK